MTASVLFAFALLRLSFHVAAHNKEVYCREGSVSDFDIIHSPDGVPLDYSYNETSYNNTSGLSSVPGCPRSVEGIPWIYGNPPKSPQTIRCYFGGTRGPCPIGQLLYPQKFSSFGVCGCECLLNEDEELEVDSRRFQYCRARDDDESWAAGINNDQVYDRFDRSVCYNLGEQGPCPNGTFLYNDRRQEALTWTCVPPCDHMDEQRFQKFANGECASAGLERMYQSKLSGCKFDEKYSKYFRGCVKANPKTYLIA